MVHFKIRTCSCFFPDVIQHTIFFIPCWRIRWNKPLKLDSLPLAPAPDAQVAAMVMVDEPGADIGSHLWNQGTTSERIRVTE